MQNDVVLPFPASRRELVAPASRVRGSWIASSIRALRAHGRFDTYVALLPATHREALLEASSQQWLSIDALMAHYQACDSLDFAPFEIVKLGAEAVRHATGPLVATAAKLAGTLEPTPWTVLGQSQKLWDRVFVGGGISVTRLGPRDARVELVGFPGWRFRYCRIGMRGVLAGVTEMFRTKAHVTELETTAMSGALRIGWT
jgi:hypothetical protein